MHGDSLRGGDGMTVGSHGGLLGTVAGHSSGTTLSLHEKVTTKFGPFKKMSTLMLNYRHFSCDDRMESATGFTGCSRHREFPLGTNTMIYCSFFFYRTELRV